MNKFYLAINHYAEEQRKKIEQEVTDFKRKELDDAELDALTEAYRLIQKKWRKCEMGFPEMAQREMDTRRELLEKRRKITDEIFNRATERLLEFVKRGIRLSASEICRTVAPKIS